LLLGRKIKFVYGFVVRKIDMSRPSNGYEAVYETKQGEEVAAERSYLLFRHVIGVRLPASASWRCTALIGPRPDVYGNMQLCFHALRYMIFAHNLSLPCTLTTPSWHPFQDHSGRLCALPQLHHVVCGQLCEPPRSMFQLNESEEEHVKLM
jgi:hypothetical protein